MIEFVPPHVSHSSINSYLRCGKAYELDKVRRYPQAPAWWLIGGSAVHKATEWIDKGEWDDTPEAAFHYALYLEVQKAKELWPDENTWLKAGYGARAQGYEHWAVQGPRYVRQWAERVQSWKWVELDVSTTLPSGIKIKAYIDRVNQIGNLYEMVDLKTGSTRPDSDQQHGIYAVLLRKYVELTTGQYPTVSAFNYMFKDDDFYEVDVSNWTLDTVDKLAQDWLKGVTEGVFLPNRSDKCNRCTVAEACFLQSGDTAVTRIYDRLNPNYIEG